MFTFRNWMTTAATVLAITLSSTAFAAMPVVTNGKPVATIVAGEGDGGAAKLLQEWVNKITGATLEITDTAPKSGPAFYVGSAATAAGLKLDDIKSKTNEGLRIDSDGATRVLIAGQNDNSTGRAVGRFLEEAWGCRWFMYIPQGEVYPETDTLTVDKMELTEKPKLNMRRIWGANGAFSNKNWKAWNGGGGQMYPMSHAWNWFSKAEIKTLPEDWFRLDQDGNRVRGHWLNLGNEDLRAEVRKRVLEGYTGGHMSMSPPDDHRFDWSPEAVKYDHPIEIDTSSGLTSMTNRFMGFVNELAKEMYKVDPDGVISFYAYSDYTLPPTNPALDKLSPNLAIWIAPIRYSRYHHINHPNSPSMQLLGTVVDGWSKRATMLGYRTYNYNLAESMTPYSKISIWSHDIPYLYERGLMGMNLESFAAWDISAPHLYLSLRLSYDPTLDPDAIMTDYFEKMYGPASSQLTEFWNEIDHAWVSLKTEAGSIHALHLVWTPERLAKLTALLDSAEKAAGSDEKIQARIALTRIGLNHALDFRTMYDAINEGDTVEALEAFRRWFARTNESIANRTGDPYSSTYLRRFVGKLLDPELNGGKTNVLFPPNKVVTVLPDEMKFTYDTDLSQGLVTPDHGKVGIDAKATEKAAKGDPIDPGYDDSNWVTVKTYSDTLNHQGYPDYMGVMWYRTKFEAPKTDKPLEMYFLKVDQVAEVFINGKRVNEKPIRGFNGFGLDVTDFVKPGENHLTVRLERIPLPELALGGIVRPIYLIEKAEVEAEAETKK